MRGGLRMAVLLPVEDQLRDAVVRRCGDLDVVLVPCPPARAVLPATSCVKRFEAGADDRCGDCALGPRRGARGPWRAQCRQGPLTVKLRAAAGVRKFHEVRRAQKEAAAVRKQPSPPKATSPVSGRLAAGKGIPAGTIYGGDWLRSARTSAGLTQTELGVRIGLKEKSASSCICQLERGRHAISPRMLGRLQRALEESR